jgi:ribosome-binding protein aMBF1 (putative translation factor)
MSRPKDPAEQLARELARESLFLPERWRIWLYESLREDLRAIDWEQHRIDVLGARMSAAISALERVADHLGLDDQRARLNLKMREFDAAPETVREGWLARQVAKVIRGSWSLAKGVTFGSERLPVASEIKLKRAEGLARKRREGALSLGALQAWLETKPAKKTRSAYDAWAKAQNQKYRSAGRRPPPQGIALWKRWRVPWSEIVQAVEEQRVPGGPEVVEIEKQQSLGKPGERIEQRESGRPLNLDPHFRGQRLKAARQSRGWTLRELADRIGLDNSQLSRIEKAEVTNSSFETWAKLAAALDLSLDELAAGPQRDLPTSAPSDDPL